MALSDIDRNLLDRCLSAKPKAWEDFVDRFMGLVVHVINHTAGARSIRLTPEDREDLCADVFLAVIKDDFHLLRQFRGQSSLATYLTVCARRIVVRKMMKQKNAVRLGDVAGQHRGAAEAVDGSSPEIQWDDRDEVARLLEQLDPKEAELVRLHHLEGKPYDIISGLTGIPENSIGPTLSRAREKLRVLGHQADQPTG